MGSNISSNLQGQFTTIRKGEKNQSKFNGFPEEEFKCFVFDRTNNTQELMEYFNVDSLLSLSWPLPHHYLY